MRSSHAEDANGKGIFGNDEIAAAERRGMNGNVNEERLIHSRIFSSALWILSVLILAPFVCLLTSKYNKVTTPLFSLIVNALCHNAIKKLNDHCLTNTEYTREANTIFN